jgi:hypothetical protein
VRLFPLQQQDFEIIDYDKVEPVLYEYIYSDGYASVLNLNEWVGLKRNTRVTQNGMPLDGNTIVGKITPNDEVIYVVTDKGGYGLAMNDFKVKNRTARTKIINLRKDEKITGVRGLSLQQATMLSSMATAHFGKTLNLIEGEMFNNWVLTGEQPPVEDEVKEVSED